MAQETYFKIDPDGKISRVTIERKDMLPEFYKALDCDSLENVRTVLRDVCLIVDECGKIKTPAKSCNEFASCFYMGAIQGQDYIAGSVILAAIHLVDGESDWVPLSEFEFGCVTMYLAAAGYFDMAQELIKAYGQAA